MKSDAIEKLEYWTERIITALSVVILTGGLFLMVYAIFAAIGNLP